MTNSYQIIVYFTLYFKQCMSTFSMPCTPWMFAVGTFRTDIWNYNIFINKDPPSELYIIFSFWWFSMILNLIHLGAPECWLMDYGKPKAHAIEISVVFVLLLLLKVISTDDDNAPFQLYLSLSLTRGLSLSLSPSNTNIRFNSITHLLHICPSHVDVKIC